MAPIQYLLIFGLVLLGLLYFTRLRSRLLDRMLILVFVVAGTTFVLHPELTTDIARRVGVGRGTDLLYYLSVIAFAFVCMIMLSRLRELRSSLTRLTREVSLAAAPPPPGRIGAELSASRPVEEDPGAPRQR